MTQNIVSEDATDHAPLEQSAISLSVSPPIHAADTTAILSEGHSVAAGDVHSIGARGLSPIVGLPRSESDVADEDERDEDMKSSTGDARDDLPSSRSARSGSFRSASGKIASLRAAFELKAAADKDDGAAKRRFPSVERQTSWTTSGGTDVTTQREREYWREIARLRGERDNEQELRRACEGRCGALTADVESLQKRLESLENGNGNGNGQAVAGGSDNSAQMAKTRTDRVSALQQQLSDLKRDISTATRMDHQVTDSAFAQEMGLLHHELQNWIVNNFRRVKTDVASSDLSEKLEGVVERRQADYLSQIYASFDPPARLVMYQATAVYFLMDSFDDPLLYGLPGEQEWCRDVLSTTLHLEQLLSPTAYNKWRATTFATIQQSARFEDLVQDAVARMTSTICSVLGKLTDTAEPNVTGLLSFVRRAVALSHLFRLQRARYQVYLPSPGEIFNPEMMEDYSDHGDAYPQSGAAAEIRCATFPAVIKIGNDSGDDIHRRNVILKAKVLCKVDNGADP